VADGTPSSQSEAQDHPKHCVEMKHSVSRKLPWLGYKTPLRIVDPVALVLCSLTHDLTTRPRRTYTKEPTP